VDVDHIIGIEHGGQPYERANLQGLCKQCHGIKTKREQR
jgi:5-methylcytosine-specific restriction endonuclease McrA